MFLRGAAYYTALDKSIPVLSCIEIFPIVLARDRENLIYANHRRSAKMRLFFAFVKLWLKIFVLKDGAVRL